MYGGSKYDDRRRNNFHRKSGFTVFAACVLKNSSLTNICRRFYDYSSYGKKKTSITLNRRLIEARLERIRNGNRLIVFPHVSERARRDKIRFLNEQRAQILLGIKLALKLLLIDKPHNFRRVIDGDLP